MTRILVIEDQAPLLKTLLDSLRFAGFEVTGALDGLIGIEMARSYQPDLVISDILMPHLDGYELLQALRSDPETEAIPVIFLTAKTTREDIRYGMGLGADDYIPKPFTFAELVSAVEARLERQAPYREMRQRLDKISQAEQLKTDMIYGAAQHLSNPITSIRVALYLLQRKNGDAFMSANSQEFSNIAEAAMRMEYIANDMLSLERIETIDLDHSMQPVILNDLVAACFRDFQALAQANNLIFECDVADSTISVVGDPEQIQDAIYDLLSNAIRYTPEGGQVVIRLDSFGDNCLVMVEDNGYGIPADELVMVFKPFYRVQTPETDAVPGLHVVKHIIEHHQGEVFVESIYGQGSILGFFLPMYEQTPGRSSAEDILRATHPDTVLRLISHITCM